VFVSVKREWLTERLASGASIEAIAHEVGRHPSSVAYWVQKHGLASSHAPRHAARGPIERELLAEIVGCELSIRDMADVFDRGPTTIRHWLRRHGLETARMTRARLGKAALAAGLRTAEIPCPRHGMTRHVRRKGGFRCARCRVEHVAEKRRRIKRQLVLEAGGRCELCGYDRCVAALQFHHLDRDTKRFALSQDGVSRSMAEARDEAAKCVLLCANCHAEVESGAADSPVRSPDDGALSRVAQLDIPG
jgi:transposase-like protein